MVSAPFSLCTRENDVAYMMMDGIFSPGYIVFKDKESVEKALAENGAAFEDKHLRVDKVEQDGKKDTKRSVFVGNVNFKASEEDLRSFFKDCGDVSNVRLVRDKTLNIGKGFGFVQFKVFLLLLLTA